METVINSGLGQLTLVDQTSFVLRDNERATLLMRMRDSVGEHVTVTGLELVVVVTTRPALGTEESTINWKTTRDEQNRPVMELVVPRLGEWPGLGSGMLGMHEPAKLGHGQGRPGTIVDVYFQLTYCSVGPSTQINFFLFQGERHAE